MSLLVHNARIFCIAAHDATGQKRKYTGVPYWEHPFAVAALVSAVEPNNQAAIAAALLHDVIEDTEVPISRIVDLFGKSVADLVAAVSDVSTPADGNRARRKQIDRDHIAMGSPDAKTIKLADLIDNAHSILAHDQDFARVYIPEKRLLLSVLQEGNPQLLAAATKIVTEAEGKLNL